MRNINNNYHSYYNSDFLHSTVSNAVKIPNNYIIDSHHYYSCYCTTTNHYSTNLDCRNHYCTNLTAAAIHCNYMSLAHHCCSSCYYSLISRLNRLDSNFVDSNRNTNCYQRFDSHMSITMDFKDHSIPHPTTIDENAHLQC